jgi:hypothetical protein
MADVDIESDLYRWMGPLRFDFVAVLRSILLRRYRGRVCYLPSMLDSRGSHSESRDELDSQKYNPVLNSRANLLSREDIKSETTKDLANETTVLSAASAQTDTTNQETSIHNQSNESISQDFGPQPQFQHAFQGTHVPPGWMELPEHTFSFFLVMNPTHASTEFLAAPEASSKDGLLDMEYAGGNIGKFNFIKALTAISTAGHLKYMKHLKCRAFSLHPYSIQDEEHHQHNQEPKLSGNALKKYIKQFRYRPKGILDIDGEQVDLSPIVVECMKDMLNMITPEII